MRTFLTVRAVLESVEEIIKLPTEGDLPKSHPAITDRNSSERGL